MVKIGCFEIKMSCKHLPVLLLLSVICYANPSLKICAVGSAVDTSSYSVGSSGVQFNGTGSGLTKKHDGFLFAFSTTAGNCDLQSFCASFDDSLKISEAGLMFRNDTSDTSPFCALLILNEKGTYLKYRSSAGQNVRTICVSGNIYPHLRIKREESTFTFYYKSNIDSIWNSVNSSYNFAFPATICAGVFHASNDTGTIAGAHFNFIYGLPDLIITDSVCDPVLFDFNNNINLDSLGFRNIKQWSLDTVSGTVVSTLNKDSTGVASISSPDFQSEIGNDTLSVSWDLRINGDTTPPWIDYSLYSIEKMDLSDRVKVSGLRIGCSSQIYFGVNDTVNADVYAGGKITLMDRSVIWGKVITANVCTLGTGAFVSESVTEYVSQSFPLIPVRSFTTGITKILISPNDSIDLAPGNYDSLIAGSASKIRFRPGNYSFSSFDIQPEVRLYMDTDSSHRIDVNVSGRVLFSDRTKMVMYSPDAFSNVSFYSHGSDTVKFGADLTLYGAFFTPNAVSHLISRNVVIKGGIYAKKIKVEPDVSIIATTQRVGINKFTTSFFPFNSEEYEHHLSLVIHSGLGQDSIADIVLQRNNDTLIAVSTAQKIPFNRDLHFEQMIYQSDSGYATCLLYDNGSGPRLLFDSVPFNISNLGFLKFAYHQGSILRQTTVHLDNISISCINDTCPPLVLIRNPSDVSVYVGETVAFACSVSAGRSSAVYQWFRDDIPIPMTNNPAYVLRDVKIIDNGSRFRCNISNVCGEEIITTDAALTVNACENPNIVSNPISVDTRLGQRVTFSVTATGTWHEYKWKRNDNFVPGATNSTYIIDSVKSHNNMDRYCVLVRNGCGKETISECALLTVTDMEPCKITHHPQNDTLLVNGYYRTDIQSICDGGSYMWYRNNVLITSAQGNTLIYGPVIMEDNGTEFHCIVSNGLTSDTSNIARIVVRPPLDNLSSIAISGELFDGDGRLQGVEDTSFVDFTVKMFTIKSGGTALYSEEQKNIKVIGGQFTITMGHGKFDGDLQRISTTHKELYAEIYAGVKGTMRIIAPRLRLTAAPYAFSSGLKVIYGSGNPNTISPGAPFGTLYVDQNDSNRTWKLGKLGWVRLD